MRSDELARLIDRRVVLADVHPVGAGRHHQVRAVVEDQQHAGGGADPGVAMRDGEDQIVVGRLHPQLDDLDPPAHRRAHELVGALIADEVEVRTVQPLATIGHAPSLAGAPR